MDTHKVVQRWCSRQLAIVHVFDSPPRGNGSHLPLQIYLAIVRSWPTTALAGSMTPKQSRQAEVEPKPTLASVRFVEANFSEIDCKRWLCERTTVR
jgi:hypothetical protein